jgi:hypothetical protein
LVQVDFAIVQHSPDHRMERIAVTDYGERSLLDLGQAGFKFADATQEYMLLISAVK